MTKEEYERAVAESIQSQLSPVKKITRDELKALYPHPDDDLPAVDLLIAARERIYDDWVEAGCNRCEAHRHQAVVHPTGCPCAGCTTPRGGFEFL